MILVPLQRLILTTRWRYLHYYQRQSWQNVQYDFFSDLFDPHHALSNLNNSQNNPKARLICVMCICVSLNESCPTHRCHSGSTWTLLYWAAPILRFVVSSYKMAHNRTLTSSNTLLNRRKKIKFFFLRFYNGKFTIYKALLHYSVKVVSAIQLKNTLFVAVHSIQTASFSFLIKNMMSQPNFSQGIIISMRKVGSI